MPSQIAEAPEWLIELINGDKPRRNTREAGPAGAANDSIAQGSRNDDLTSLAGKLRRAGASRDEIEAALLTFNATRCAPPLDDDEVRAIARSIANYEPGASNDVLRTLNDVGNAERFARRWGGDVRYVPELGKWVICTWCLVPRTSSLGRRPYFNGVPRALGNIRRCARRTWYASSMLGTSYKVLWLRLAKGNLAAVLRAGPGPTYWSWLLGRDGTDFAAANADPITRREVRRSSSLVQGAPARAAPRVGFTPCTSIDCGVPRPRY
jgi:hypothetical protein